MKILFLSLCLCVPCSASSLPPLTPLSIKMELEEKIEVYLLRELLGPLKEVTLTVGGVSISIPDDEIKDIVDPDLLSAFVQAGIKEGKMHYYININFDRRIFEWSEPGTSEASKVTLVVVDGSYQYRNVSAPGGKDNVIIKTKKVGEKEKAEAFPAGKVEGIR